MDNLQHEKRDRKQSHSRLEGLARRRATQEADLDGLEPAQLSATVIAVLRGGGAIMFGMTSDGGALCVTLLEGGERHKEYVHSAEEIAMLLEAIRVEFEGV